MRRSKRKYLGGATAGGGAAGGGAAATPEPAATSAVSDSDVRYVSKTILWCDVRVPIGTQFSRKDFGDLC